MQSKAQTNKDKKELSPLASRLSPTRGFTILFSVLIASILLAIGIAILNITVKELRLSSTARESEIASYLADSGAECALYNGFKLNLFSTTTANTFVCNGQNFPNIGGLGWSATSTFTVQYGNRCATVSIAMHPRGANQTRTIIDSRGYNTCDVTNPNRIERAFRVIY